MTTTPNLLREPQQSRSVESLRRIVIAAYDLLDQVTFEKLTVADVMRRAGLSVGLFYTRFANKAALLPYLYELYDEQLESVTGSLLNPEDWVDLSLAERVRKLVEFSVDTYRAHKGLWRAILVHASSDPSIVTDTIVERRSAMVDRIVGLFLEHQHEVRHPEPEAGVRFCLVLLFSTCKDQILLQSGSHGTEEIADDQLKDELTRTLHSYLGLCGTPCLG